MLCDPDLVPSKVLLIIGQVNIIKVNFYLLFSKLYNQIHMKLHDLFTLQHDSCHFLCINEEAVKLRFSLKPLCPAPFFSGIILSGCTVSADTLSAVVA